MHSHFHDTYSHLDSPLHRVPATIKLSLALALVLLLVAAPPSPILFTLSGFVLILLAAASNGPTWFIVKRLLTLEPFVFCVAALTLLHPDGGYKFATIVTRSTLCLLTMILLTNTTPFSELLGVLRRARLPSLIVTILALMHRYLFVFKDEQRRMRIARQSRTFSRSRTLQWKSMASVIGVLFARSSERAERIYNAMCARGWT